MMSVCGSKIPAGGASIGAADLDGDGRIDLFTAKSVLLNATCEL